MPNLRRPPAEPVFLPPEHPENCEMFPVKHDMSEGGIVLMAVLHDHPGEMVDATEETRHISIHDLDLDLQRRYLGGYVAKFFSGHD